MRYNSYSFPNYVRFELQTSFLAFSMYPTKTGTAMEDKITIIEITTIVSIKVSPLEYFLHHNSVLIYDIFKSPLYNLFRQGNSLSFF